MYRSFTLGFCLFAAACAFRESPKKAESANSSENSPRAVVSLPTPTYAVQAIFPDNSHSRHVLTFDEKNEGYENKTAVVVPLPVPKQFRLKLEVPQLKGENPKVSAKGTYGGKPRNLHSTLESFDNSGGEITSAEVTLHALNDLLAQEGGISTIVTVLLSTDSQTETYFLTLRTPPAPIKAANRPFLNASAQALSPTLQAVPLVPYDIENQQAADVTVHLPTVVRGQLLRQIAYTTHWQGSKCGMANKTDRFRSPIGDRFLLMPKNAPVEDFIKASTVEGKVISEIKVPAFSKTTLILHALVPKEYSKLDVTGQCFSETKLIVNGCHQGNCARWHGEPCRCRTTCCGSARDCCGETKCDECHVCDEYEAIPNSADGFTDHMDVVGHGFELENLWNQAHVYYADVPVESAFQGGPIINGESKLGLSGSYSIESPVQGLPTNCVLKSE